jgi:hypothetical protein
MWLCDNSFPNLTWYWIKSTNFDVIDLFPSIPIYTFYSLCTYTLVEMAFHILHTVVVSTPCCYAAGRRRRDSPSTSRCMNGRARASSSWAAGCSPYPTTQPGLHKSLSLIFMSTSLVVRKPRRSHDCCMRLRPQGSSSFLAPRSNWLPPFSGTSNQLEHKLSLVFFGFFRYQWLLFVFSVCMYRWFSIFKGILVTESMWNRSSGTQTNMIILDDCR